WHFYDITRRSGYVRLREVKRSCGGHRRHRQPWLGTSGGRAAAASLPCLNSISGRALRIHIERIERMACSHEQPIALAATEANIGAALRQRDKADRLAFGIEHFDAV